MKQYKLKELCILTNTTRSAIQGYHRHQLINYESKDKMGHLLYNSKTIDVVKEIKLLQDSKLSLKDIENIMSLDIKNKKVIYIKQLDVISIEIKKLENIKKCLEDKIKSIIS